MKRDDDPLPLAEFTVRVYGDDTDDALQLYERSRVPKLVRQYLQRWLPHGLRAQIVLDDIGLDDGDCCCDCGGYHPGVAECGRD